MKWPWISRRAFDLVEAERDRLAGQNDQLVDQLVRMERWKGGMTETPREPRKDMEPMPQDVYAYCQGFGDKRIARQTRNALLKRHARGEHWNDIRTDLKVAENGAEP